MTSQILGEDGRRGNYVEADCRGVKKLATFLGKRSISAAPMWGGGTKRAAPEAALSFLGQRIVRRTCLHTAEGGADHAGRAGHMMMMVVMVVMMMHAVRGGLHDGDRRSADGRSRNHGQK